MEKTDLVSQNTREISKNADVKNIKNYNISISIPAIWTMPNSRGRKYNFVHWANFMLNLLTNDKLKYVPRSLYEPSKSIS